MILRTTRSLAASVLRALTLLLLIMLVSLALYVSVGRQLVPRVADYKDWLEQRLSQELGMSVSIGGLRGEWLQFTPRFVLQDLQLGDVNALQLQQVSLAPALLESLQQRRLVIADTVIDALDISFHQQADGRWQLAGLTGGAGPAADADMIFQLVTRLSRLSLSDTQLMFVDIDGNRAAVEQVQLDLQNTAESHLLQIRAELPGTSEPLRVDAALTGFSLADLSGQLYLNVPQADYSVFMPRFPAAANASVKLTNADIAGELWVDLEEGRVSNLIFRGQADVLALENLQLENVQIGGLHIRHEVERDLWSAYANDIGFELAGQLWPSGDMSLNYQPGSAAELKLQVLDLGILSRLLTALPVDERLITEVVGFNPRGQLQDLKLNASFSDNALSGVSLASNIDQGALTAFRGAPSFWGVDGYAEFNFDTNSAYGDGFVEVDSTGLSMHLPGMFNDIWDYDRVNGRVGFRIDGLSNTNVRIASGVMVAESDIIKARGQFATEIQLGENSYIDLELKLGALEIDVSSKTRYLPTAAGAPRAAQGILQWVDNAVLAGNGAGSGLIFRGRVQRGSTPQERTLQMFYSVVDGTLKFDPAWPAVEELDGFVLVDNDDVDIAARAGSTLGINFNPSVASVRSNPGGGRWLTISGQGSGTAAQGLQYLQQTPVTAGMAQYFSTWVAEGDADINLALGIPLNIEGAKPEVSLSFSFADNRLFIPEYDLQIDELAGSVLYTDEQGLRSENITALALGQPVIGSIVADGLATRAAGSLQTDGSPTDGSQAQRSTVISWSGITTAEVLTDWSGFPAAVKPILTQFDGEFAYDAELLLPADGASSSPLRYPRLQLRSGLENVVVSLPAPFSKSAQQTSALNLNLEFRPEGPVVDLRWQDRGQINLVLENGLPQSGLIYLGSTADGLRVRRLNPSAPGVEVLGTLPVVDYASWQQSFSEMFSSDAAPRAVTGAAPGGSMTWLSQIKGSAELSVGELLLAGESFEQLNISLRRLTDAWQLGMSGEDISGSIIYPLGNSAPWQVQLDHLHLGEAPVAEVASETSNTAEISDAGEISEINLEDLPVVEYELPREDPLRALDPRNFPPMQLSVGTLSLAGADFGSWSFELESDESGAVFRNLRTTARGLSIGSESAPAEFRWIYDGQIHRSVLNAQIVAADMGPVLSAYGYAPSLQSTSARFDARLHWDGSPAYFSALGLSGDIDIKVANGRFQQRAGVANSALRLISIINFDALVRRLRFSDDFLRSGLSYDEISGRVNLTNGIVNIIDRLQIIGPASLFQVAGELNLAEQTIDADLFITLPVSDNIPWLGGFAVLNNLINWQLAIGVFLFDRIFGEQVDSLTSAQYTLEGPWESVEPKLYQVFASGS